MVESKIESLVQRLEAAVARAENVLGSSPQVAQSTGQKSSASMCKNASDWQAKMSPLVAAFKAQLTTKHNDKLIQVSEAFIRMTFLQTRVFEIMATHKHTKEFPYFFTQLQEAQQKCDEFLKDFKAPRLNITAIQDGLQIFTWPCYTGDNLKSTMDAFVNDEVKFSGNKILRTDEPSNTAWYNAYLALVEAIVEFLSERADFVSDWTGKQESAQAKSAFEAISSDLSDFTFGGSSESSASTASPQSTPAAKPQPQSSGSLAQEFAAVIDPLCATMKNASEALKEMPDVVQFSDRWIECVKQHGAVFETQKTFKKPEDFSFLVAGVKALAGDASTHLQKNFKAPKNHIQTLIDGLDLFFWLGFEDAAGIKEHLSNTYDELTFCGNRVIKKGTDAEKAWIEAYYALAKGMVDLLSKNAAKLVWSGSQDASGAQKFFESQVGSSQTAAATPSQPQPAKEEAKKAAPISKPKPKAPAVKEPIRQKQGSRWVVENFKDETVTFTEDEIDKRVAVVVFGCQNTTIKIQGKCQAINISGCKKVRIEVDSVLSYVDVSSCQDISVTAFTSLHVIQLESVNVAKVILNSKTRACKVNTICCRSVFVTFPKEGCDDETNPENQLKLPIAEVYESILVGNSIKTEGRLEEE